MANSFSRPATQSKIFMLSLRARARARARKIHAQAKFSFLPDLTHLRCDVVTSKGGKNRVIAKLGAGDFFGETGLLEGRKERAASVVCTSPVEVMAMDRAAFNQVN